MSHTKTIFVGMSGGVDSSVSAALLKEQAKKNGWRIVGAYIKTWQPEWLPCTWREERRDAMRVAAVLDIPLITIDCEHEYKQKVADYMIAEYRAGRTPNPDIMCNKEIKFGSFLTQARAAGADMIATGHYAQNSDGKLYEGVDPDKDQSYFLGTLTPEQLKYTIFPVGHLHKKEVRALARHYGLPTAEKKDSQGICFLGNIDMKEFLKHYIPQKQGEVLDTSGTIIGWHNGAWFLTIGERHGFTITKKTDHDTPYYIVGKDVEKNTITVSHKKYGVSDKPVYAVTLTDVVVRGLLTGTITARLRYRQKPQGCTVSMHDKTLTISFTEPQDGVSVGQSVVLYKGTECIGGGVIEKVS